MNDHCLSFLRQLAHFRVEHVHPSIIFPTGTRSQVVYIASAFRQVVAPLLHDGVRYLIERAEFDAPCQHQVKRLRIMAQHGDIDVRAAPLALDAGVILRLAVFHL
jgi:hypothetical protein